jgi:hypothetical protein
MRLEELRLECDGSAASGLIADPVNMAKSLLLPDEGFQRSEELFREPFTRHKDLAGLPMIAIVSNSRTAGTRW